LRTGVLLVVTHTLEINFSPVRCVDAINRRAMCDCKCAQTATRTMYKIQRECLRLQTGGMS
jgi:hypothetical protein